MPIWNEHSLGEAIHDFLAQPALREKMADYRLQEAWSEIAGEYVAKNSLNVTLRNKVVTISSNNSSMRYALLDQESELLRKINLHLGFEAATKIIFK